MKVLAFNGSPHRDGTTHAALEMMAQVLRENEVEVKIIHVGHAVKGGCTACGSCSRNEQSHCIIDDVLNDCIDEAKNTDGFVFASPVYYGGIAGGMKSFMDRFFRAYGGSQLQYKVGASVAVARRAGTVDAFNQLNNYLYLANMLIVPSRYWSGAFGSNADETVQDMEGMQNMRTIAVNMAWLLATLDAARASVPLPALETRVRTNFIH